MKTHKILQLIGGGEIGGAEQHVLTLLKEMDSSQYSLVSGCLIDGPFARLTEDTGIPTLRFPMRHALDLTPLPQLIRESKRQNFSMIHTHGSRANLLGRLAGRLLKIPVVSTVHSSLKQDYLSPSAAFLALTLDRLTLPLTSGIITVSEALAYEVSGRGGQKIRTIYNGVRPLPAFDSAERLSLRQRSRQEWGIPADALVLGSIARLHPTKGITYLIAAATLLQREYPNLHLLLVGDGPLRSELETQLSSAGLSYTLTGFQPEAFRLLPAMDLFILPSLSEGMGLVILEAMQANLPIIASEVGGIPEVIRSGLDGLLVPSADPQALAAACRLILSDPDLACRLTESGAKHWTDFSVSRMIKQTEGFYQQILYNY